MQKIITKYGLAAHLAILAVAPLFLSPFFPEKTIAVALLWLSGFAAVWLVMEPSVLGREMPHNARARVVRHIRKDPLFWSSLVLIAIAALRAFNGGVGLGYDAETQKWLMREPMMPMMPASSGDAGFVAFASLVAICVVLQGVRHGLGRSARMLFLLTATALAGLSATISLIEGLKMPPNLAGWAYGVAFVLGVAALVGAFEREWNKAIILVALSIGGTGAGLFAFAAPEAIAVFAIAALPVGLYSFYYAHLALPKSGEFKGLVVFALSLVVAVLAVMATLPSSIVTAKVAPFISGEFLTERFFELRQALSDIALKVWKAHPWSGTGLGTFGLDIRLNATEASWDLIPDNQAVALNGWWQLLSERGIVGAAMVALPLGLLTASYVGGIVTCVKDKIWFAHPMCVAGLLTVGATVALAFVDASWLRPEALMSVAMALAMAAKSFPARKRESKGRSKEHG